MSVLLSARHLVAGRHLVAAGGRHLVAGRHLHGPGPREEYYAEAPPLPDIPAQQDKLSVKSRELSQTVRDLRTVEEKLYYLNKPKYYGWSSMVLRQESIIYGSLDLVKYLTWTHTVEGMPKKAYADDSERRVVETATQELIPQLERFLNNDWPMELAGLDVANDRVADHEVGALPHPDHYHVRRRQNVKLFVKRLHRIIHAHLAAGKHRVEHLREAQVDYDSRSEAFWFRGGLPPSGRLVVKRENLMRLHQDYQHRMFKNPDKLMTEEGLQEKLDQAVQYEGQSLVQLRHDKMIEPFAGWDEEEGAAEEGAADDATPGRRPPVCRRAADMPGVDYPTRTTGYPHYPQNGTNTAGFWTCTDRPYVNLQLVSSLNLGMEKESTTTRPEDREETLLTKAILAGFGCLLPTACYAGHGPFNDPSEPLTTQLALTDGHKWKLTAFQLNKTALFEDFGEVYKEEQEQLLNNVCWHEPEFELFKEVEENGQTRQKVDPNALAALVRFYVRQPTRQVKETADFVHNIRNNYNREYFTNSFRYMYSKRQRSVERPFIQWWQKLYMLRHPRHYQEGNRTRPWFMMARIDFKGREHWHPEFKHYDYYRGAYAPRKFRAKPKQRYVTKVVAPIPPDAVDD